MFKFLVVYEHNGLYNPSPADDYDKKILMFYLQFLLFTDNMMLWKSPLIFI